MNPMTRWMECCALALALALSWGGFAAAQIPEVSYLPIDEPTEIGGTVLEPGIYVIRVVPNLGSRAFVQVMDEDQESVLATALSVPHPLSPGEELEDTKYVFLPATEEHPRALRSWFAPGSSSGGGHDFVYSERTVAPRTLVVEMESVDPIEEELAMAEEPPMEEPPMEVTIAEAEPMPDRSFVDDPVANEAAKDERPVMVADALELPRTAGRGPLLATLGVLLLGAATGLRSLRSS